MTLKKDGIERVLTDKETIKIFKDAGWIEVVKKEPKKEKKDK